MSGTYFSSSGTRIHVGKEFARGGEGSVHEMPAAPEFVAKLYIKPADQAKAAKLDAMTAHSTSALTRVSAWPAATLHDAQRRVVGFLMPRVVGHSDIHQLFSPKSRMRAFPTSSYKFLVRVSANLARAFHTIHEHGHVIGDVNSSGACVSANGTVTLVDCDSFQIQVGATAYTCDVATPTHQPPEMQGVSSFRGTQRTPNHDAFGLAVLIFQTLFLARHPFAGTYDDDDMTLERAIAEQRFAYAHDAHRRGVRPPPATLPFAALPPTTQELFARAFVGGRQQARPTAQQWYEELDRVETSLVTCSANPSHQYIRGLAACALCRLEGQARILLFVPPVVAAVAGQRLDLDALWREVSGATDQVKLPNVHERSVATSLANVQQPPDVTRYCRNARRAVHLGWTFVLASVLVGIGVNPAGWLGCIALWLFPTLVRLTKPKSVRALVGAQREVEQARARLVRDLTGDVRLSRLQPMMTELQAKLTSLRGFDARRASEFRTFESNRRARQMERHLERFSIEDAKLKGFGPGTVVKLESFGVESAADVSDENLTGIKGVGKVKIAALMAWRARMEASFVFHDRDPEDDRERRVLEQRLGAQLAQEQREALAHAQAVRETARLLTPWADSVRRAWDEVVQRAAVIQASVSAVRESESVLYR